MSLNCCSLRSQEKRNDLAALLISNDIDIVLGCESHLDDSFYSSEILPKTYTVIRKDRCLGGGGVFVGYKTYLSISNLNISCNAEMLWCSLHLSNKKPIYLCSFYRPPNSNADSITELYTSLLQLTVEDSSHTPCIILAGDFNLRRMV